MLSKITVTNFKSFEKDFTFDLSKTKDYQFNEESVRNGLVNTGMIYGKNGVGKSNLGFAIFDLISHLTNKKFITAKYQNYTNANCSNRETLFEFEFLIDNKKVAYSYSKTDLETLVSEKLTIDGKLFASIDRNKNTKITIQAKGAESLKNDIGNNNISILSYIEKNAILDDNSINRVFFNFISFINRMLYVRALDTQFIIGFENQKGIYILDDIVAKGNLKNLEEFLNKIGVECELNSEEVNGEIKVYFQFKDRKIAFLKAASSGTWALVKFYLWYQRLIKENDSCLFFFLDEFDAFYHHKASETIVKMLRDIPNTQVILTTHNTSNMNNDTLRPDCYFVMEKDWVKPVYDLTEKELREAHNLERMFRAGKFE